MRVRTEERRDAIVEAAARLFRTVGYERASMNELAKMLGGSKATLYNYFPSKEALFVAVVRAYATRYLSDATEELLASAKGGDELKARLARFGEHMLRVLTNDSEALGVYRMVVAEAGRSNIGMLFYESGPSEGMAKLATVLAAAMEGGELRKGDSRLLALQLLALITAETQVRIYQNDPQSMSPTQVRQMVKRAIDMFFAGAGPVQAS